MNNGKTDAGATAHLDGGMIISVDNLRPGDVLLYRPSSPKAHQRAISNATGSPYTHAAIYLGDDQIADSNMPWGVAKGSLKGSIKGSRCVAVLRSQAGFGPDRARALNEFVETVLGHGKFYDLFGALSFSQRTAKNGDDRLEFIRLNYGKITTNDEFSEQKFFCSAFIVACYSVTRVIGTSAQVLYEPNMFSPGCLHKDPTFGWLLGYIVPEGGSVPDDDPVQIDAPLWREIEDLG